MKDILQHQPLISRLLDSFQEHSDAVALTINSKDCSYSQLYQRATAHAALFKRLGVERVALCGGKSFPFYYGMLGSILSNTTFVFLSLLFHPSRSAFICKHAEASHILICKESALSAFQMLTDYSETDYVEQVKLLCNADVKEQLRQYYADYESKLSVAVATEAAVVDATAPATAGTATAASASVATPLHHADALVHADELAHAAAVKQAIENAVVIPEEDGEVEELAASFDSEAAQSSYKSDSIMYIGYTSGSTGDPKGVQVSREAASYYVENLIHCFDHNASTVFSQLLDISFAAGLEDTLCAWIVGAQMVVPGKKEFQLVRFCNKHNINVMHLTPNLMSFMQKAHLDEGEPCTTVKKAIFIGEPLTYRQAKFFKRIFPEATVINTYGCSEATATSSHYTIDEQELLSMDSHADVAYVPMGEAINNVTLRVVDEHNQDITVGETGQLIITAKQLTVGYIKNDVANAKAFTIIDGKRFYMSGDYFKMELDASGKPLYRFNGRRDDVLKYKSVRISLAEVDESVAKLTQHRVCAVAYPFPAEKGFNYTLAVAIEGATEEECAAIMEESKTALPYYMQPDLIAPLEQFPTNTNGKMVRRGVKEALSSRVAALNH